MVGDRGPKARSSLLFVGSEEEIVGAVGHQLSLTRSAGSRWNCSTPRIQALDEGGLKQEVTARGPLGVSDGLQQQALNRSGIRATVNVRVGVDAVHFYSPHLAAIERTLPCRVPAKRRLDAGFRIRIDALKVSDDLELLSEEICKESGFGTSCWAPGSAAGRRRQACIALAPEGVSDQVCRISLRYCNGGGSGWRRNLRCSVCNCADGARHRDHREKVPYSRSFLGLLMVETHKLILRFNSRLVK